jgi:ELWxxDGT repeat protein
MNPSTALYKSDGTAAGTMLVAPKIPLSAHWLSDVDGRLVFQAGASPKFGPSIWRTRGTAATTRMLKDLGPDGGAINWGGHVTDHHAYFNTAHAGLWASDGTTAGTRRVGSMSALWSTSLGDQLYFAGSEGSADYPVFTSNGTAAGTHRLDGPTNTVQLGSAGNTVFMAENGELWTYVP